MPTDSGIRAQHPYLALREFLLGESSITAIVEKRIATAFNDDWLTDSDRIAAIVIQGSGMNPMGMTLHSVFSCILRCYGPTTLDADTLALTVMGRVNQTYRYFTSSTLIHDLTVTNMLPGQIEPDTKFPVAMVMVDMTIGWEPWQG